MDPVKYKWIQFETTPDENNPNRFYLDDIVCLDSRDNYHFYQIKFKQDTTNKWNWDDLLISKKDGGMSLIKKWSRSLLPYFDKCDEALFITNGQGSNEITRFLSHELLDFQKIKSEDFKLYTRLVTEIGNDQNAIQIFQKLRFFFNQEDLLGDKLENNIRGYFYEKLSATKSGVTNLFNEIHKECRQRKTRKLDIETIRRWCEFDTPKPLNEQFEIPLDFEFFDKQTHKEILRDLQKVEGGVKVIFGKPGVGKSVYLSELDKELENKKIISIKHHYHLSPEDSIPQERLNANRVIEAIKAQIKLHKEELADLANRDSKNIPLSKFIKTVSTELTKKKKSFVIILDGLDHVLRYGAKNELEELLLNICHPQPGVWIVIGMQLVAKQYLPRIIIDKCPEDHWIEIKGLSKKSVSNLVRANNVNLNLPDREDQLRGVVRNINEITKGNPLHLRYTLRQLKNLSGNSLVTEYSCRDPIPYSDEIEKYYESLWEHISDNSQKLLLTIASVNFRFTEEQLIECISSFSANPTEVTRGFNEISHLISRSRRGRMSVYHNSFEVFLKHRPELKQQNIVLKTNIRRWLEQSDYDYLKWAELKLIENDLGNSRPILEIDREWLIEAICRPCNSNQISNQINTSIKMAFENEDFAKALQISHLHTYYLNSKDFVEEASDLIWKKGFSQNDAVLDYIEFDSLPSAVMPKLVELAESKGDTTVIDEIINVLIDRLDRQEYRQNTIPGATSALMSVLPYDRRHDVERMHKYILQFRKLNITESLFRKYSSRLLDLDQIEKFKTLLKLDLTPQEKNNILIECAKYGLTHNNIDMTICFDVKQELPLLCLLYIGIKGENIITLPKLPQYNLFSESIPEHDFDKRKEWDQFYYNQFLIGILYCISGKDKEIEQWIKNAPNFWSARAMCGLYGTGTSIASGIKKSKINYKDLSNSLIDLEELKWPEDRESINFQYGFRRAFNAVLEAIISIKTFLGDSFEINLEEYDSITDKTSFYSKDNLMDLMLDIDKPLLVRNAYEKLRDEIISQLFQEIGNFPERAESYAKISKLARLYGEDEKSQYLLKKAADNLLGYGYHKDVNLFEVLEAIEICAQSGTESGKIDDWLDRVIPLCESVGDYTDGDETHHLPFRLAEVIAKQNPTLLYRNYFWYAHREELYHAEDIFKYLLNSLSYTNEVQIALASTAIDQSSLSELKEIAQNNGGASKAVDIIQDYLGVIEYPKERDRSEIISEKQKQDYSKVSPNDLIIHLTGNFENRWDWNEYLIGWLEYWLKNQSKEDVYNKFKEIIVKFGVKNLSGELLDKLYPLAYEFDNNEAFEILCSAQEVDHGWDRYWTDKKKAERRWQIIKNRYPKRYLEFFRRSTNYHVPLTRGVEYFFLFNDSDKAEAITEASVEFAQSLMADLNLPVPEWAKDTSEIDCIDILLQRLLWPSPLVRERAASGIAELLNAAENKEDIYNKLLSWISNQKMESAVAIGLLPIIKAFYGTNDKNRLNYIGLQNAVDSIGVNSIVIERLIEELARLINMPTVELPEFKSIIACSNDYIVNSFFSKYIDTFLAPIYSQRAQAIEKASGKSFMKQWAFTAENIFQEAGIAQNSEQVYFYARHEHDKFLTGFSSKVSEVFRSAFLRVLQHFAKNNDISEDDYLEYAYSTLPIELSKWKISPNRAPEWWPKLENSDKVERTDKEIDVISFRNHPEDLVIFRNRKRIVAAEGAIQPAGGWQAADPMHSFLLVGFGYKVIGPRIPIPEKIAEEISSPSLVRIPSRTTKPFNFLEDQVNYLSIRDEYIRLKDILIYPLVVRERDLCIALWQYYRDFHMPLHLSSFMEQELNISLMSKNWEYNNNNGKLVAKIADWLEGLKERNNTDMPIPHGQYLCIDEDYLDQWLGDRGLKLGYVLEIYYRSRKYSHDDVKKYKECKLLNVSSIITP